MREDRHLWRAMKRPLLFACYLFAAQMVVANPVGGGNFEGVETQQSPQPSKRTITGVVLDTQGEPSPVPAFT